MEIHVHELKLTGDSEFSKKFNQVSEAYSRWRDAKVGTEEKEKLKEEYYSMKYCLEMGM